jgi:hypothetical protein
MGNTGVWVGFELGVIGSCVEAKADGWYVRDGNGLPSRAGRDVGSKYRVGLGGGVHEDSLNSKVVGSVSSNRDEDPF